MKILKNLIPKLFIIAFAVTMVAGSYQLGAMEPAAKVVEQSPTASDLQIYLILSEGESCGQLGLTCDVIKTIVGKAYRITRLIQNFTWDKPYVRYNWQNINTFCNAVRTLKDECCPNMVTALVKMCMNGVAIEPLTNVFRLCIATEYLMMGCNHHNMQIILLVMGKNLVELLKVQDMAGETALHNCIRVITRNPRAVGILKAYLVRLSEYAQGCPDKCKEVLELLSMKDNEGNTALRLAKKEKQPEVVKMLKNAKKEFQHNVPKDKKRTVSFNKNNFRRL